VAGDGLGVDTPSDQRAIARGSIRPAGSIGRLTEPWIERRLR
jgi:hypothetical protein